MNYEVTDNGETAFGIPIKRITWEDGAWWDVLAKLTYGTASKLRVAAAKLGRLDPENFELTFDIAAMPLETALAVQEEMFEIRLFGSTVAWSFKEGQYQDGHVAPDAFGETDSDRVRDVRDVLNGLHEAEAGPWN